MSPESYYASLANHLQGLKKQLPEASDHPVQVQRVYAAIERIEHLIILQQSRLQRERQ